MAKLRIAPRAPYVLYRVHLDGTEELVSEHPDFRSSWQAGTHVVSVDDKEGAYSLYDCECRVARFGNSRLMRQVGVERLSSGYRLDTINAAICVLRRPDGTAGFYFSVWSATRKAVERAARVDHRIGSKRRTTLASPYSPT